MNNMTKSKLKEIMDQYCITESELDDIVAFITDLLYVQRKELEENEPYATRTIDEIYKAEIIVDNLNEYVNELEEE